MSDEAKLSLRLRPAFANLLLALAAKSDPLGMYVQADVEDMKRQVAQGVAALRQPGVADGAPPPQAKEG